MRQYFFILLAISGAWVLAQESPEYGYDYIPDVPDSVIEARLKAMSTTIPMVYTDEVRRHIQLYTVTKRDYARKVLNRSSQYFPLFEKYLAAYGLPDELKYLAVVESGLAPKAVSHAAAVGLWQFIYTTGKAYGLESNWYYDDRIDPEKSTEAACRFLNYLYNYFGDWELALAAYNSGAGRVNRAIRYADGKRNFWSIYKYLPNETKAYVPKFVAVAYVFTYAEEHNLYPDNPHYMMEYDTLHVSSFFHLETFAEQANLCMEDLEQLNPQIKHAALPATAKQYPLRIPADLKEQIVQNRAFLMDTASKVARAEMEKLATNEVGAVAGRERLDYKVRSGDVLGSIASRYNVRVSDIKQWNRLSSDMIRAGQVLKIWVRPGTPAAASSKSLASNQPKQSPQLLAGQKTHYVVAGDTLWDISKTHNISIEEIKALNNLSDDSIKPGQTLIVSGK
jgi:membrane-bound lytic murein transglycosylase D